MQIVVQHYLNHIVCISWTCNVGWLVFNGTFSTKRLYHAIGE